MGHLITCRFCGEVKEQIIEYEANHLPKMWCCDLNDVWRKHWYKPHKEENLPEEEETKDS
jgi:hypothetical protein